MAEEFGVQHELAKSDLLRLSFRVFRTKPVRTILTILGMSVGIGTVVILISLGYGLQYILIGKLVTTEDSLITLGVTYPQDSQLTISPQNIDELTKIQDAAEVIPEAEFFSEIKNGSSTGLITTKMTEESYFRLSGIMPDIGKSFTKTNPGVVLSSQAAKILGLDADNSNLNKEVSFNISYQSDQSQAPAEQSSSSVVTPPMKIIGFITDDAPPYAIIPIESLSTPPPFYKEALVKAKDLNSVENIRNIVTDKGYVGEARLDMVNQAKKVMNIITSILGVFGIAALVVSAIGMFNTMIVGFLERIYEVGIMKSLGASDKDVRNLFFTESLLMGFLGGTGGILIGVGGGKLFNLLISLLSQHFGGKAFELFQTPIWFIGVTIGLSSLIGLAAGFWPAIRSANLSPKEAFRSR